jgi:hypothetical protein
MFVRSFEETELVRVLREAGHSDTAIARETGIPRSTVREWRINPWPRLYQRRGRKAQQRPCPVCTPGTGVLSGPDYAYLLGLYLGDGHISRHPRTFRIRFFLDAAYPQIVSACRDALEVIRPGQRA